MKLNVTEIQRFCMHDGPGLRTTVFLKGCPLRCRWCHNPEAQRPGPQVMVNESRCIRCGACVRRCPAAAISLERGKEQRPCREYLNRQKVTYAPRYGCGKCQVNVPCSAGIPAQAFGKRGKL